MRGSWIASPYGLRIGGGVLAPGVRNVEKPIIISKGAVLSGPHSAPEAEVSLRATWSEYRMTKTTPGRRRWVWMRRRVRAPRPVAAGMRSRANVWRRLLQVSRARTAYFPR